MSESLASMERIHRAILVFRGQKVILDRDLAVLYGVPKSAQTGGKEKPRPIPHGLYVCPDSGGVCRMEVTVCDLQGGPMMPFALLLRPRVPLGCGDGGVEGEDANA